MAVRPAKDKQGKTKPGYYVIDYYPFGSKGERSMREYKVSEAEAYALEKGATHIHAHLNSLQQKRLEEEADLITKWKPKCNEQLV